MKNNFYLPQLIVSLLLLLLLILISNPFGLFISNQMLMMVLTAAVALFGLFSLFILKEKARDEREERHLMAAGRIGFLVGSGVLILGIIVQSSQKVLDPWLIAGLIIMVLAKIISLVYQQVRN